LSETGKYRKFTAQQKTEIVIASLRGPKSMAELCREDDIADSLLRKWREQFLAAGASDCRVARNAQRLTSCAARSVGSSGVGAQDDAGRGRRGTLAGLGASERVARSRELIAQGRPVALVARVAGI
jgi:hypothetical protein